MHIKSFIIGLLLFLIGGSTLWWMVSERKKEQKEVDFLRSKYSSEYEQLDKLTPEELAKSPFGLDPNGHAKTQEQLQQGQMERLKADMEKLAAGEMSIYPSPDDFYGENWRDEVEKYKKQKEVSEFIQTGSIMCTSIGGIIVSWFLLLNIARIIIKILSGIKHILFRIFRGKGESEEQLQQITDTTEEVKQDKEAPPEQNKEPQPKVEKAESISKVLVNSGWQYTDSLAGQSQKIGQRKRIPLKSKARVENKSQESQKEHSNTRVSNESHKSKQPLADKDADKDKVKSQDKTKNVGIVPDGSGQLNPIDDTLKDLTQQVSAIREYAAHQQDRLEKLQDGYDWNIIKSFCLRVIRCIDNIENRIEQLEDQDCDVTYLEEFRDELIFSLESSGVEQYKPEINSEYRGQEKFAEAVKEKKHSNDPKQKGRIEKVIRPGYQCFIDEENVRIVRPAQVRLYA
jgi:molecular chaperone GrpE (heat shock protein)